ncbi:MAG: hypothetical protein A2W36_06990 [Chloroflexi bacterium RBG_16_58_14]|nr:MAG: hypothetical protein A2W36_06990 [Chloroflexi bacterium RBG_16_58_14]
MLNKFGVLWDMDGVLVDTAEFHFLSWEKTLGEMGIPFERGKFQALFGRNNHDTLASLLQRPPEAELLQTVNERKETLFRALIHGQAQPLPGVRAWLERLRRLGALQAVASSAPQENIDLLVDELGLRPYFAALCAGHRLPGKPDPALFLLTASVLGLPPRRCLVVEDSLAGIEAAHRAGMKCLAVASTNPVGALGQADLVLERLDQMGVEEALGKLGVDAG